MPGLFIVLQNLPFGVHQKETLGEIPDNNIHDGIGLDEAQLIFYGMDHHHTGTGNKRLISVQETGKADAAYLFIAESVDGDTEAL